MPHLTTPRLCERLDAPPTAARQKEERHASQLHDSRHVLRHHPARTSRYKLLHYPNDPLLNPHRPLSLRVPTARDVQRRVLLTPGYLLCLMPTDFRYAVEVRIAGLLGPDYRKVLENHGVAHIYNHWSYMPSLREQHERMEERFTAPFTVLRLLTPLRMSYEAEKKRAEPYTKIVEASRKGLVHNYGNIGTMKYVESVGERSHTSP